jgi:N-formylglutamate amidohydrolase
VNFDVLAPDGGPALPLVAHVPHGGVRIPAEVRRALLVDDERLEAELLVLTDWHTGQLYAPPVVAMGGVAIVNRLSRLVVDPERLPDAREPLARIGLGAIYTRTSDGTRLRAARDAVQRVELLDRYLQPWADTVDRLVSDALDRHGQCLVLDGHSFPSRPLPYEDPALARPDVCLGFADPHAPRALIDALTGACRARGLTVAHNQPFAGAYVPLARFGLDRRVTAVMVELNRAGHLDEATGERGVGFADTVELVRELVGLVAATLRG